MKSRIIVFSNRDYFQYFNNRQAILVNTLRPWQNGRHFADDISKCTFLNENVSIAINISLKFVPKGPTKIIPVLVQIWTNDGQFTDAYMRHSA